VPQLGITFNDRKYHHSDCPITDWSNQTQVEDSWLGESVVALPDLDTG
jgi:alpha-amylase